MRPPERTRLDDTAQWLALAAKDLDVGKILIKKGQRYWDFALFHIQQSVEKSIKGFLIWHDRPFKKVHLLGSLGQLCVSVDPTLNESLRSIDVLSKYAVEARYPGELLEEPTKDQVKEAVEIAGRVLREVLQRLPKESHAGPVKRRKRAKGRR